MLLRNFRYTILQPIHGALERMSHIMNTMGKQLPIMEKYTPLAVIPEVIPIQKDFLFMILMPTHGRKARKLPQPGMDNLVY